MKFLLLILSLSASMGCAKKKSGSSSTDAASSQTSGYYGIGQTALNAVLDGVVFGLAVPSMEGVVQSNCHAVGFTRVEQDAGCVYSN